MKRYKAKNRNLPVSFIVRIYRFSVDRPEGMVGVVESVGSGDEGGFTGIEGLWAFFDRAVKNRMDMNKRRKEKIP